MTISEKLFQNYSYLAKKYAGKIYSYEDLSYEYEDLVQEFSIKIFTSIKAYGRRWAKYRQGTAPKPVPLRFYLEGACGNKVKDFIKYISREQGKVRIDDINYDYGYEETCTIDTSDNKFVVNDIDLLEGLTGKDRAIFSLFLRGFAKSFLNKVYNSEGKGEKVDVSTIIDKQRNYLITTYGAELQQQRKRYASYSLDEE